MSENTGRDVKELLTVTLRSHVWNLPTDAAVEMACAEALAALEPCLVLSAEEAAWLKDNCCEECLNGTDGKWDALLTPQKVPL